MPKLKQYGVITPEEYEQTKREGKFLISDDVTCSYCESPVTLHETLDPSRHQYTKYFHCEQHERLVLAMHLYPGSPALAKESPRYGQMDFHFSLNEPYLSSTMRIGSVATQRGCPFCDRYMPLVRNRTDLQGTVCLLNRSFFCEDCGVSFRIVVEQQETNQKVLALRFQPNTAYMEDLLVVETPITETAPTTLSDEEIAARFLESHLLEDAEHFQPRKEVYTRYEALCATYNTKPLEDRKLYQQLRKLYNVEDTRRRIDGIPTRGFIGIRCLNLTDD